jgi:uncharacterized protein with GYD domain
MPRYLIHVSYSPEGLRGLVKNGGSARRKAAEELVKSLGGKVEAFYFTFGESDVVTIAELPDNAAAAALGITVGAAGGAHTRTTVLLTPEELDDAAKKKVRYSPPKG